MKTSEKPLDRPDEIVIQGRVFKPMYKHLLDKMPRDLVQEMARRRLDELNAANHTPPQ
jgi:hypothetical protein